MTNKEAMQMALDTLSESKRSHYYCEDRFYSCPMHEEGCADALEGDECNCGANFVNETIEKAIEALRTALAQPEPDARKLAKIHQAAWNAVHKDYKDDPECCFALGFDAGYGAVAQKVEPSEMKSGERFESFPASPNKEWVGLTDEERKAIYEQADTENWHDQPLLEAVEAKLKEKNNG